MNKMPAQDLKDESKKAAKYSFKAAKAGAKVAKGIAMGTISPYALLIGFGIMLLLSVMLTLPAASSTAQMSEDTYYISVTNADKENRPSAEDREDSLYNQEKAREKTTELLKILSEIKEYDLEENIKGKLIKKDCEDNDWDYDITLSKAIIDSEVVSISSASKSTNNVQNAYDFQGLSVRQLSTYTSAVISKKNAAASKEILESEKTTISPEGFWMFDTGLPEKDYLVGMGSFFGGIGSRFRVTFTNGESITVLKAETFDKTATGPAQGMVKRGGGLLEFLIENSASNYLVNNTIAQITKGKGIKKIELLESEFSSQSTLQMSTTDSRVLAAYSVYLDNMELEAKNYGLVKKIVNQRGDPVQTKWFWSDDSVDVDKSFRDILMKFLKRKNKITGEQNSFYHLDYKRDADGNIIVESIDLGHYESVTNAAGEVTGSVWVPDIRFYATPIIIELDINSIAEDLYNLDPDEPYINSGKPYQTIAGSESKVTENQATIRDAVNTIAEATDAVLFNVTADMQGNVILTDLQGQLLWPAPGYTTITSPYGKRTRPTAGASSMHRGIDIGAPLGSPIVAAADGTVSYAGYNGAGGIWVSIKHDKGLVTDYGHLQKTVVSAGQPVKRGQVIAFSGNTGVSTGPHLHFQVVVRGNAVNPVPYVIGS